MTTTTTTTINNAYAAYIKKTYAKITKKNPQAICTIYYYSERASIRQKYHIMPQNSRHGQEWIKNIPAVDLESTIETLKKQGIRIAEVYVPGIGRMYCF